MSGEIPIRPCWRMFCLGVAVIVGLCSNGALSQTMTTSAPAPKSTDPVPVGLVAPEEQKAAEGAAEEPAALPGRPFSLGVTYYLFSDYVFRGVNFSEYESEGRERLNHQMTTSLGIPIGQGGKYGTFGFDTFFEWYEAQKALNSETGGQNLQEVDYTLRWSYQLEPIATKLTLGWTDYTFPNANAIRTNEAFVKFEHNDAWLWRGLGYKGEEGILNPSLFFAQDVRVSDGYWVELGINHPFKLSKNLTLTPKMTFALDGGYLDPLLHGGEGQRSLEYAYTQYGVDTTYDLTEVLHLPAWAGTVFISGQLYYNQASDVEKRMGLIKDEFYGGMALGWSW